MLSREERTPFSEWWWTVDKPLFGAILVLMLTGVILSLAASPPVATRIGLDAFHFFNRHVLFLLPSFIVLIGVSLAVYALAPWAVWSFFGNVVKAMGSAKQGFPVVSRVLESRPSRSARTACRCTRPCSTTRA